MSSLDSHQSNAESSQSLIGFRDWLHRGLLCLSAILLATTFPALAAPGTPARIVSLDLCMDWILAHHADPAQVAALSPMHKRYPIQWIEDGWPTHDGTLEQVVELQPDLVLAGQYSALLLRERLRSLGYRVEVLPLPSTFAEVENYERTLLTRSEEHTSELQSRPHLVCRLLLE